MFSTAARNAILSAMYPRAFSSGARAGPCFLVGAPEKQSRLRFKGMLAAGELFQHGLQVVDSSLQHDNVKWKFVHR